jgi:hypothetical protein
MNSLAVCSKAIDDMLLDMLAAAGAERLPNVSCVLQMPRKYTETAGSKWEWFEKPPQ